MIVSRDLYVPIAFIEALGWATIRRYQFEHAVNILVAAIGLQANIRPAPAALQSLNEKLMFLADMGPAASFTDASGQTLRSIGNDGARLTQEYSEAALGAMYSRGFGDLEETMRELTVRAKLAPPSSGMTPSKVKELAEQFTALTREAASLAAMLLSAAEPAASK